jgi:hypothetical protein
MDAFVGSGEAGQKIRDAMVRGVPLGRIGVPDDYPGLVAFSRATMLPSSPARRSASRAVSPCTAKEARS